MFRKLVRAYIVKGCWHLLENKHKTARASFIKAKKITDITGPFNLFNSDPHVIKEMRKETGLILSVLIKYIDKERVTQPDCILFMTEVSTYIKLYTNLNRILIQSKHSITIPEKLIENLNIFNDRMEKLKLFFDKNKQLQDYITAFLLKGYLLINKCQMKIGKFDKHLIEDISRLYKEMANHYLQLSLYNKNIKNNINKAHIYIKLHQDMVLQAKIAQSKFYQMQCEQYIDKCENTCLHYESLETFINAVDSLAKMNQFLSLNYTIFINLCCKVGRQIKNLFLSDGSQIELSTCNNLVLRLEMLVKIYKSIEMRFDQNRHRLQKYHMPLSSMMQARLLPLLRHYTANANDKIQILSKRINNAGHSESSSPEGSDNGQAPSLEIIYSLFPEASDIFDLSNELQDPQFESYMIGFQEIEAWSNFGVIPQMQVGDKRRASAQSAIKVEEDDSDLTAFNKFKRLKTI